MRRRKALNPTKLIAARPRNAIDLPVMSVAPVCTT
jgi:hypothetical protein